ncbi:MAG: pyruvate formate lyase family protein, partial [Armatimonadota bacterium]
MMRQVRFAPTLIFSCGGGGFGVYKRRCWWYISLTMTIPTDLPLMQVAAALRAVAVREAALSELPPPEREAAAFAAVLADLPCAVHSEELLAGDWGWQFASAEARETVSAVLSTPPTPAGEPSVLQLLDERFHCRAGWSPAHTCADYRMVVGRGLRSLLFHLGEAFEGAEGERASTLRAMRVAVQGVIAFAHRLAELAERQGLADVAAICRKVPEQPAETMREALQAIWIVHLAVGVSEYCDSSLSLGRLDQYLYPLFESDRQRGVPLEELHGLLVEFWRKLNRFGDPACAVNLGGQDAAGNDLWNPLTDLIVAVTREVRLPSPILAARVHDKLPDEVFDALLSPELLTIGQPTFYGEDACRETMVRRGVPVGQAARFAINSCMGLVMPGEEIADMWGVVTN